MKFQWLICRLIFSVVLVLLKVSQTQSLLRVLNNASSSPNSYPNFVYKSYQNGIYCTPSFSIKTPKDVQELVQIVQNSISSTNQTIKAFGSRHSVTDVICTDGIAISMSNINSTVLNDDGTATFGAGLELKDAMEFLESFNKTLIHIPSFAGITIGGAVGCGAHGSSLIHPTSLSDQVVKLTIIDGTGTIRVIDQPDDLNAFRVHLGLLGILINVTLQTVPLFKMTVENTVLPDSILTNGTALNWAQQYHWFEMWWFPSSSSVVVSKGNYTWDLNTPGNASTNLIPDEDAATIIAGREGFETLQATRLKEGLYALEDFTKFSLYKTVIGKPPLYSEDGKTLKNPATGYGWRLQGNKCEKCAWSNAGNFSILPEEFAMAFELHELPKVINTMKNILQDLPAAFAMVGVFIRFSRPSPALMAISTGRPTVHLEWATPMRHNPYETSKDGIAAFQAILQAMLIEHDGRPHWGKNGAYFLSKPILQGPAIPNRQTFINAMLKFDPNGRFLNKFGQRLLGQSNDMDIDPQVEHKALQEYSLCSRSSDCATGQFCYIYKGTYPVCKDLIDINVPSLPAFDPTNLTSILEAIKLIS